MEKNLSTSNILTPSLGMARQTITRSPKQPSALKLLEELMAELRRELVGIRKELSILRTEHHALAEELRRRVQEHEWIVTFCRKGYSKSDTGVSPLPRSSKRAIGPVFQIMGN